MDIFSPAKLANLTLQNRIIRSATFEGMADENGFVTERYIKFYDELSKQNIGAIICGFSFISPDGRAMQPGQIGVDAPDKIPLLQKLTHAVHRNNGVLIMQLAHAGRQTLESITHKKTVSSSAVRSIYFNQKPKELSIKEIEIIVEQYGNAALYCKQAGFDGIQLHAAHGYLIHQFITPAINRRRDIYGIDNKKGVGTQFLKEIIDNIRQKCGAAYPILLKVSGSDDLHPKFTPLQFINLVKFLHQQPIDAIEISYGTMDYAINIFRGDIPVKTILKHNPIYKTENRVAKLLWKSFVLPFLKYKIKPYSPAYNLHFAQLAKEHTTKPIISVGGFRNRDEMVMALQNKIEFVSLSRPFICEPDFVKKIEKEPNHQSKCTNCNICAIMCDTKYETHCYSSKTT